MRDAKPLAKAGIEPSVGSVGHAYANALSETINALLKTEVIPRHSSCKTIDEVELENLNCLGDARIGYRLNGQMVQSSPPV
jgi:transposase InsO family protein